MSARNWRLRLEDMLEAVEAIQTYTTGLDFSSFAGNRLVIDAVIRNLEIIGESSAHVPSDIQKLAAGIAWQQMKGLRNLLTHEYFGVDVEVIWATIQQDLPDLKPKIVKLLQEQG